MITSEWHGDHWQHTMTEPWKIGPRLMPSIVIGDARISIESSHREDDERRIVYHYAIDLPGYSFEATDLRSGAGGEVNLAEAMAALLDFLTGVVEDWPPEVAEWAQQNEDEIGIVRYEISPEG